MENNPIQLVCEDKNSYWDVYCLLPTNGHLSLVLWAAHTFLSTNLGIHLSSPTWKMTLSPHSHQQWAGSLYWAQKSDLGFDPIILVLKPSWLVSGIPPTLGPLEAHEDPWERLTKGSSTRNEHWSCQARLSHALFWCQQDRVFKKLRAPCHGMPHVKDGSSQRSTRRSLWL